MQLLVGPVCNFSAKVLVNLAEKGVKADIREVPFTLEHGYQPTHDDVARINPTLQVPVLIDGALEIYDSTIICEYLDEAYAGPALLPADPNSRALCRLLEAEADEILWPLLHRRRTADSTAEVDIEIHSYFTRTQRSLTPGPFLCGQFSLADTAVWVLTHLLLATGYDLGGFPAMADWYQRTAERPAFIGLQSRASATLSRLRGLDS